MSDAIPAAVERLVARHYGGQGLEAALRDVVDLDAVAHFHSRGERATVDLAALVQISSGHRVLDVGGGLGGAARLMASRFGCGVTVVDLTEDFVRLGMRATADAGLSDRVHFRICSALDLPFEDGSFDRVLTQHVSMNVADKARLYREARRVLKPGGWLGLHEIVAGGGGPVIFPVPWAHDAALSFLRPHAEFRRMVCDAGFEEQAWADESGRSRRFFAGHLDAFRRAAPDSRPPGVHLLLGADAGSILENMVRNLDERRVEVVMAALLVP